jgi:hypothetical protein
MRDRDRIALDKRRHDPRRGRRVKIIRGSNC